MFWGILGLLSETVDRAEGGETDMLSSGLRGIRATQPSRLFLWRYKPHSPPHNPNRAHAHLEKIRESYGILGLLRGSAGEAG